LKKIISGYDAIIVRSETKLTGEIIEVADRLKVIGRAELGLDNVDLPAATKKGIVVMILPRRMPSRCRAHDCPCCFPSREDTPGNGFDESRKMEKKKFTGVEIYNRLLE